MVKKISSNRPVETLLLDLEKYAKLAVELGASNAKVVPAADVQIDERVRAKCSYPKCSYWGTNPHCPPHAIEIEDARRLVASYRYGLLMSMRVPSDNLIGPNARESGTASGLKMYEVASQIESNAFYDGYYLAVGLAAGCCKRFLCPNLPCSALTSGNPCRHPLKSRPSMESMGIDVYGMATAAGWDIYPIGGRATVTDVPHGHRMGLVLID